MINLNLYQPLSKDVINRDHEVSFFKKVCDTLTNCGYKNWIDFGALLGAYREGKVIDHDWDLDVLCIENKHDTHNDLFNFNLLACLQEFCYIRYFRERNYISVVPRDQSNFKLNHICIGMYRHDYTQLGFREFFIDELDTIKLNNIEFSCPRHLDLFIPMRYGSDWKTPNVNFVRPPGDAVIPNKTNYVCYTSMVGDLFHEGHVNLLKRCKFLFDKVIVGVHNDEQVASYKGVPHDSYEVRLNNIKNSGFVDEVLENAIPITTNELIDQLGVDFVVAGREDQEKIKKMYPIDPNKLHLIKRTDGVCSSDLRKKFKSV